MGGCRDASSCRWRGAAASEDVVDCAPTSDARLDDTTSNARLVDTCSPLLPGGPARLLGYPTVETPLEEDPQALIHRARPRREGFPLGEDE